MASNNVCVIPFTPGPVLVPRVVADSFANLHCSHHRQGMFRNILAEIQVRLKELLGIRNPDSYHAVILCCTGTGANEACLLALKGLGKGVIVVNGSFGERLVAQANQVGIDHLVFEASWDKSLDSHELDHFLSKNGDAKWLYVVSHETRSGIANPLEDIGKVAKRQGLYVAADIVSSAFVYPIDIESAQLDLAVTTSAKGLMSFPGLAIVFLRVASAPTLSIVRAQGYYLDLIGEFERQSRTLEPRFAQPYQLFEALLAACTHLNTYGISRHMDRIRRQMHEIADHLETLGLASFPERAFRSWACVNFSLPQGLGYRRFSQIMEREGYYFTYAYPDNDLLFQVSTIGDISDQDVREVKEAFSRVLVSP